MTTTDRTTDRTSDSLHRPGPAAPYGRTDGLTERGSELRGNLSGRNARTSTPTTTLAQAIDCRYCHGPIYLAWCSDGRWRSFEREVVPAAATCVWAWRKRQGMQETEHVPGHRLHYCAEYGHFLTGAQS